jgi:hypothetical protein
LRVVGTDVEGVVSGGVVGPKNNETLLCNMYTVYGINKIV